MCIIHKWGKFTDPVDTSSELYKAQFRSCEKCNKIQVKYVSMTVMGIVASVKSEEAIKSLKEKYSE